MAEPETPTRDASASDHAPFETILDRTWREPLQSIRLTLDGQNRGVVVIEGKGSIAGAHALIKLIDDARDELGHHIVISSLVDLRRLEGAPLRAQFVLGKWLLARRKQIHKVAIFGGKPFEMGLARAIMTIAGMGSKAWFGNQLNDALSFLEWPRERYPT